MTVAHDLAGADYDAAAAVFFYDDADGTTVHWYRLTAVDDAGRRSIASTPFQARAAPAVATTVKLDHNYGSPNALRYQTSAGTPVEGAVVRLYYKSDFDQGLTDHPLAVTVTGPHGGWASPVYVPPGFTYVVHYHKEGMYGPDHTEVLV